MKSIFVSSFILNHVDMIFLFYCQKDYFIATTHMHEYPQLLINIENYPVFWSNNSLVTILKYIIYNRRNKTHKTFSLHANHELLLYLHWTAGRGWLLRFVQKVFGLVDLGRQIGRSSSIRMVQQHDLLVRVLNL